MKIFDSKLSLLVLVGLWLIVVSSLAQTIPAPQIEAVSVSPDDGTVTISWTMDASTQIDGFIILWLETTAGNTTNHSIDTINNAGTRKYSFRPADVQLYPPLPDPNTNSVSFTVSAFRRQPFTPGLRSVEHYNINLYVAFDSCTSKLHLDWQPYIGWGNRLADYRIMQLASDGTASLVATANDTTYETDAKPNTDYTFYIEALRDDQLTATCFRKSVFTKTTVPPAFINADKLTHHDDGTSTLDFTLDANKPAQPYVLLGSESPTAAFAEVQNVVNAPNPLALDDATPHEQTWYYLLAAVHHCDMGYTTLSDTITALWLTAVTDGATHTLRWDTFIGWNAEYRVYRTIGKQGETLIATLAGDAITYADTDIDDASTKEFCYRVEAVAVDSAGRRSISNSVCLQPESEMFFPDAFTPNADGLNDIYTTAFSFPPVEYLLQIYDRFGAKIYETSDYTKGWDGQLPNRHPAGEGVYGVYVKFKTKAGRLVEKRGTVMLLRK